MQITPLSEACNLGCWFDSQLSMVTHKHNAAFYHLYNLRKIRNFLDNQSIKILVIALIASRLDHCNSLLFGTPATHLLTYRGYKIPLPGSSVICHNLIILLPYWYPMMHLHWLPITFKVLHGLAPEYLDELISVNTLSRYQLWSHDQLLLSQPKFNWELCKKYNMDYAESVRKRKRPGACRFC